MFALVDCSEILSAPPPLASGIPVKLEPLLPEWCELDCTSVHRLPNEPEERSQWKLGAAAGGPTLSLLTLGFDTCSPLLTIASTATRWTTLRRRAAGIVIAGNGSGRWNSETSFAVRCQVSYSRKSESLGTCQTFCAPTSLLDFPSQQSTTSTTSFFTSVALVAVCFIHL